MRYHDEMNQMHDLKVRTNTHAVWLSKAVQLVRPAHVILDTATCVLGIG
jgi:hypothetical protein